MPDFAFEYIPSPTTLFRFSALTFNGHYIHLDKDYAQKSEGYPGTLLHQSAPTGHVLIRSQRDWCTDQIGRAHV